LIDSKSKKQLIVLGVLVPFLAMLIIGNVTRNKAGAPQPAPPTDVASAGAVVTPAPAAQASPDVLEARRVAVAAIGSSGWGRNPFVAQPVPVAPKPQAPRVTAPAPKRAPPKPPVFHLVGIVYDVNSAYAVINDELRMVGDRILGYVITKITKDTVTLEKNGESMDLKMFLEIR